jgi:hypothetical protein
MVRAAGAAVIATLALATSAYAQTPPHDHGPLFLPGVQYGTPLKIAAGLAVYFETSADGDFTKGFIVEAGAGQGGVRASFGLASFLEYMGLDARGVVHRTFAHPRGASSESTYLGGEAGLTIAYVRLSLGVAQRIAGPSGEDRTILTWTVGVHVPLGW